MAKGLSKERIHPLYEKNKAGIHIPSNISSAEDLEAVKEQMLDMQMEIDILKETINVLKKRPRRRADSSQESGEGSDNRRPEE